MHMAQDAAWDSVCVSSQQATMFMIRQAFPRRNHDHLSPASYTPTMHVQQHLYEQFGMTDYSCQPQHANANPRFHQPHTHP